MPIIRSQNNGCVTVDLENYSDAIYDMFEDIQNVYLANPKSEILSADNPATLRIGFACLDKEDDNHFRFIKIWTLPIKQLRNLSHDLRIILGNINFRQDLIDIIRSYKSTKMLKRNIHDIALKLISISVENEWTSLGNLANDGHRCLFGESCQVCIDAEWEIQILLANKLIAEQKSKLLLKLFLNEEQRNSLELNNEFVVSSQMQNKYCISKFSVRKLDNDKQIGSYCIVPFDTNIPFYDAMLAKLLLLKSNEEDFINTSKYTPTNASS